MEVAGRVAAALTIAELSRNRQGTIEHPAATRGGKGTIGRVTISENLRWRRRPSRSHAAWTITTPIAISLVVDVSLLVEKRLKTASPKVPRLGIPL